ncbi:hypothetical protein QFW77_02425 [Luteimonas sp. RD2P54]|uniref:Uncharacterized protein n=1 Tax=Luteimonas endophytica TaxID=3042023 RepID=A0ABT6J4V1_9GAMM|nr:hypothetical protein [Luteimonas endophytica]MDH5821851.1 hypothetical protein [Luteimonas endophytica]
MNADLPASRHRRGGRLGAPGQFLPPVALAIVLSASPALAEEPGAVPCVADGDAHYVCGFVNPEDVAPLQDGAMVLVGKLGPGRAGGGGPYLVDGTAPVVEAIPLE